MADDPRIEAIARALACHRLNRHELARQLHSDSARQVLDSALERLWPSLKNEAYAIVEALDRPAAVNRPTVAPSPAAVEPIRATIAGLQDWRPSTGAAGPELARRAPSDLLNGPELAVRAAPVEYRNPLLNGAVGPKFLPKVASTEDANSLLKRSPSSELAPRVASIEECASLTNVAPGSELAQRAVSVEDGALDPELGQRAVSVEHGAVSPEVAPSAPGEDANSLLSGGPNPELAPKSGADEDCAPLPNAAASQELEPSAASVEDRAASPELIPLASDEDVDGGADPELATSVRADEDCAFLPNVDVAARSELAPSAVSVEDHNPSPNGAVDPQPGTPDDAANSLLSGGPDPELAPRVGSDEEGAPLPTGAADQELGQRAVSVEDPDLLLYGPRRPELALNVASNEEEGRDQELAPRVADEDHAPPPNMAPGPQLASTLGSDEDSAALPNVAASPQLASRVGSDEDSAPLPNVAAALELALRLDDRDPLLNYVPLRNVTAGQELAPSAVSIEERDPLLNCAPLPDVATGPDLTPIAASANERDQAPKKTLWNRLVDLEVVFRRSARSDDPDRSSS